VLKSHAVVSVADFKKSHKEMGNNKCQRAKARRLWKREDHVIVLLRPFIERELRYEYIATGTAEYISDTGAVMEEPDRWFLLKVRHCLLHAYIYIYFCPYFMPVGNND
jgi:hypothetical protein